MAERSWSRASVRLRTTLSAVLVVAVVLLAGGLTLVFVVRASIQDGVEGTAEQRASELAAEVGSGRLPASGTADEDGDLDDEPEELVWQVVDRSGRVVRSSQPLADALPIEDGEDVRLPGADADYVVVTEEAGEHGVVVAASLEEVDDSVSALVPPLLVGLPLVLLVVGATTCMVATRALAPVERIRREAEKITGDRLDRRVPEPASRDEIGRLAVTMNQMLGRLQDSRDRQREFVGDASHELRSPLAAIRQTAEVARSHPGALPEGELAEAVLEEAERMQRIVEQLLLLTRLDEGAPLSREDVDLDDLALAEARRLTRDGIRVDTGGVGPGRVLADRVSLAQVVRNLVDNAARHARSSVSLGVRTSGRYVELVVEDDGAGIPEPERARVFERFVRLDEARARDVGGSGLGLAIVHDIVASHGGSVHVESAAQGGARLVVRLPA